MKKIFLLISTSFFVLFLNAQNTNLGFDAGYGGSYNTSIGYMAGDTVAGLYNTMTGSYSGYRNSTGNFNNFFGYYAGYANNSGSYNNFFGNNSGQSNTTGNHNSFKGYYSGRSNTTGSSNNFIGNFAGYNNTTANNNSFLGVYAGYSNNTGASNNFIGNYAGYFNTAGNNNCFIGNYAGYSNTTGSNNTYYGNYSGRLNTTGINNCFIGNSAGHSNISGNYNVFIGNNAGYNETGSNKLYIDNSNTITPLIYGDFSIDIIRINGKFGINCTPDNSNVYVLAVNGPIRATEIKVESGWADFVFTPSYKLRSLTELDQYIKTNGHLPELPKAEEVQQNGVNLGEMQTKLLQKVEELTLYLIDQQKQIEALKQENKKLKKKFGLE